MYCFHLYTRYLALFVFVHEVFHRQSKCTKHWITFLSHCRTSYTIKNKFVNIHEEPFFILLLSMSSHDFESASKLPTHHYLGKLILSHYVIKIMVKVLLNKHHIKEFTGKGGWVETTAILYFHVQFYVMSVTM